MQTSFNSYAAHTTTHLELNTRQISSDVMLCGTISWQLFAVNPEKMSVDCEVTDEVIANSSLSISLHEESWGLHFRRDLMQQYLRS